MTEDPNDITEWSELPAEERSALRRAAQSNIWWTKLGQKIKGMGPIATAILAALALMQVFGESVRAWFTN